MDCAKVFTNGGSQAVRLPKSCQFNEKEVSAHRIGNLVILAPPDDKWDSFFLGLSLFTDDFLADGIEKLPAEERAEL